ncbi:MAG: hypothetical protein ACR2M0_01810 [Chloroflexia bacterium]
MLISASTGPQTAHQPQIAESFIYRRGRGGPWEPSEAGLPPARGTLAWHLTSNDAEPGVFYAGSNHGIYRLPDGGQSWEKLDIAWPDGFRVYRLSDMMVV